MGRLVSVHDEPPPDGAPGVEATIERPRLLSGAAIATGGTAAAFALNRGVPFLSPLTTSVLIGAVVANTAGLSGSVRAGLTAVTRRLLRAGIVLLGLQLSLASLAAAGLPMLLVVVLTVTLGFAGTRWIGARLDLPSNLVLFTATGFAICGASAIVAMEGATEGDNEDDVATAIALVTIFGSFALLVWPLLRLPLGLGDKAYGSWSGASVHEVAQVVAAASPAGATALATAVVVKLARVVLLAPLVASVTLAARRRDTTSSYPGRHRPPLVPLFVLGFLAMIAVRTTGLLPSSLLSVVKTLTTVLLAAALFGLGTGVRLRALLTTGPRALLLGLASTVLVATVAYAGVLLASPRA